MVEKLRNKVTEHKKRAEDENKTNKKGIETDVNMRKRVKKYGNKTKVSENEIEI